MGFAYWTRLTDRVEGLQQAKSKPCLLLGRRRFIGNARVFVEDLLIEGRLAEQLAELIYQQMGAGPEDEQACLPQLTKSRSEEERNDSSSAEEGKAICQPSVRAGQPLATEHATNKILQAGSRTTRRLKFFADIVASSLDAQPLRYKNIHDKSVTIRVKPDTRGDRLGLLKSGDPVYGFPVSSPSGQWLCVPKEQLGQLRLKKGRGDTTSLDQVECGWLLIDGSNLKQPLGRILQPLWGTTSVLEVYTEALKIFWQGIADIDAMYTVEWRLLDDVRITSVNAGSANSLMLHGLPEGSSLQTRVIAHLRYRGFHVQLSGGWSDFRTNEKCLDMIEGEDIFQSRSSFCKGCGSCRCFLRDKNWSSGERDRDKCARCGCPSALHKWTDNDVEADDISEYCQSSMLSPTPYKAEYTTPYKAEHDSQDNYSTHTLDNYSTHTPTTSEDCDDSEALYLAAPSGSASASGRASPKVHNLINFEHCNDIYFKPDDADDQTITRLSAEIQFLDLKLNDALEELNIQREDIFLLEDARNSYENFIDDISQRLSLLEDWYRETLQVLESLPDGHQTLEGLLQLREALDEEQDD